MESRNIIRVISLFKNHYLDRYEKKLPCDYTTFGYFDGLSVTRVESYERERLMSSAGNINLTDVWYEAVRTTKDLEGFYGKQLIYALRYEDGQDAVGIDGDGNIADAFFWESHRVFISVILMQFSKTGAACRENCVEVCKMLEQKLNKEVSGAGRDVMAVAYGAIDNCDGILFIKSNSYREINKALKTVVVCQELEDVQVKYSYSIIGVNQDYLEYTAGGQHVKYCWTGDEIPEKETVDYLQLNISLKEHNDEKLGQLLKELLNARNIPRHYDAIGQKDVVALEANVSLKNLMNILNKISLTDEAYSRIVYNISLLPLIKGETSYGERIQDGAREKKSWCREKIWELTEKLNFIKSCRNEKMTSYICAMLQFLNALEQFESSSLACGIYEIVAPSLMMFFEQFDELIHISEGKIEYCISSTEEMEEVDTSIEIFLKSVDSILYRVVQADQKFFEIPGYNAVLFDIPTKLCLMTMAFMNKVTGVLLTQDDKQQGEKYNYQYCLSPSFQAKPETRLLFANRDSKRRVIEFSFSQRHLFMPRSVLIVMVHEIVHYVGDFSRQRQKRLHDLIKMMTAYTVDMVFDYSLPLLDQGDAYQLYITIRNKQIKSIRKLIAREVDDQMINALDGLDEGKRYYMSNVGPHLLAELREAVFKCRDRLSGLLSEIAEEELAELKWQQDFPDMYFEISRCLNESYKVLRDNMDIMLADNRMEEGLELLVRSMKECYSDLIMILLLKLEPEYYLEAFLISEGDQLQESFISPVLVNRVALVFFIMRKNDFIPGLREKWEGYKGQWGESDCGIGELYRHVTAYIEKMTKPGSVSGRTRKSVPGDYKERNTVGGKQYIGIFNIDFIWRCQLSYLEICCSTLIDKCSLSSRECQDIDDIFSCFKRMEMGNDYSFKRFFDNLNQLIQDYDKYIEKVRNYTKQRYIEKNIKSK